MQLLSFLIWIFLYFGQIANIKGDETVQSNFGPYDKRSFLLWETFDKNPNISCSLDCHTKSDRDIVVHTAKINGTCVNVPVADSVMALVYYSCNETGRESGPELNMTDNQTLQKICNYYYEKCTNYNNCWRELEANRNKGTTPKLSVDLTIPSHLEDIMIRTKNCEQDRITFTFKVDNKPIDYEREQNDYNYTNNVFVVKNLEKTPIVLEIKKFPEKVLALITFNLTRNRTESCTNIIQDNCSLSCRKGILDVNRKCHFMVNNKSVEIASIPETCFTTGWNKNAANETVYEGACAYFHRRNITLCQYDCVDMPNCSYMCFKGVDQQGYIESEYIFHTNYTGKLGSRQWTWDNVPNEMVLVNECLELPGLCKSPKSCEDLERGYRCKLNDYNNMACLRLRKYKFIQCPHDIENFVENKEPIPKSMGEITDFYEKLMESELPPEYKYEKMFNYFVQIKGNYTNSTSVAGDDRRNIARFLLNAIQTTFRNYILSLVNDTSATFRETKNGIYAYARRINKTENEVNIPLSVNNGTGDNEFVKFQVNQTNNSSGASSVLTFMYYNDTDLAGESDRLDKKAYMYDVNAMDPKDRIRYKNSDIIYLSVNGMRNVSIRFKLKQLRQIEHDKKLYTVEDECGYLAEKEWRWSVDGCRKVKRAGQDYCECDHLSNFAMLFSMRIISDQHLTIFKYLTIVGSIINVLSLLLFLVFVLVINPRDKMRIDQLNIATSLLFGTLVFVFSGLLVKYLIICKVAALLSQYLFLSAFAWMLILGINVVHMIASLNSKSEDWMVKYRLLIWPTGYGVSLVIVVLSGYFYWADYGQVSDNVCWINHKKYALLTFIIPVGIIIGLNVIGLFYIANAMIRNYINTRKIKVNESKELLVLLQLMVSMGLTWFPSYFATYYITAMYFFVIFFPLQGLMMFLCVVVMNKDNREKVSSYISLKYSYLKSKSATISGMKTNQKSKNNRQNQYVLSDKEKKKDAFQDTKESDLPLASIRDRKNTAFLYNTEC